MEDQAPQPRVDADVELVQANHWCVDPDVHEGCLGEEASPIHHDEAWAEGGGQAVAEWLPQVEALEGALPAAVQAAGVVRLTDELLPANLEYTIKMKLGILNMFIRKTLWRTAIGSWFATSIMIPKPGKF